MIRHEPISSIVRFYPEESDDPLAPYTASCMLVWETPTIIWIKGLSGTLNIALLRDFAKFLLDNKIETIRTFRASNHTLPLVTTVNGNYCEIDVAAQRETLEKIVARGKRNVTP